jgi:hypothetical protein
MLTASVTGAGLIIAFYALIFNISDKMFARRTEEIIESRKEIEKIRNSPELFSDKNREKTIRKLNDLDEKINSITKFPRYLQIGVGVSFMLFIISALICTWWLRLYTEPNNPTVNDWLIVVWFMASLATFAGVGVLGLVDVRDTLNYQFNKLTKQKEEAKITIINAPKEITFMQGIASLLTSSNVPYSMNSDFKYHGKLIHPDFVIPSINNPKYVIEVVANPTNNSVYNIARMYQPIVEDTKSKTIIVGDFKERLSVKDTAKAYWTYVVDFDNLEELKAIIKQTD